MIKTKLTVVDDEIACSVNLGALPILAKKRKKRSMN